MTSKNYINGQWVEPHSQEYIEVVNPANGEKIGSVPQSNQQDVDDAVQAARAAFPAWNQRPAEERLALMEQLLVKIEEHQDEFAKLIVEEFGSSIQNASQGHVPLTVREMQAFIEAGKKIQWEETFDKYMIQKEGYGVVACITPWNYPLNQIQRKYVPALIAGNTVVVKPPSITPLSAVLLAEIIDSTDLPKGVFNVVFGSGSKAGDYLAGHEDVDVISFTGSTEVGRNLYTKAGPQIKHLVLELGGKSPLVYLEGGDLEGALEQSIKTIVNNQGQTCSALTRFLVPRHLLAEAEEKAIAFCQKIVKIGDPMDPTVTLGPLSSEDQFERVMEYIEKGKEEGAKVIIGGKKSDEGDLYIEPTIFSDVTNDMTIAQEEIFGPVLCLIPYDSEEEAVKLANDTIYGLSGAVVGPQEKAEQIAKQIRTGNVFVNFGPRSPEAPFGGYKQSGIGRENGIYGIDDYLEIKTIFLPE